MHATVFHRPSRSHVYTLLSSLGLSFSVTPGCWFDSDIGATFQSAPQIHPHHDHLLRRLLHHFPRTRLMRFSRSFSRSFHFCPSVSRRRRRRRRVTLKHVGVFLMCTADVTAGTGNLIPFHSVSVKPALIFAASADVSPCSSSAG